jgi:hypothetical protein
MKRIAIIASLMILFVLTACTIKAGWVSINFGNRFSANYQHFNGKQVDRIRMKPGETLTLNCEVEVKKGILSIQVVNPQGKLIWVEKFLEDAECHFGFTAETGGVYKVIVLGDQTRGSFELDWIIEP